MAGRREKARLGAIGGFRLIARLGVLKLSPLPMLLGLMLAQFAWLAAATGRKH